MNFTLLFMKAQTQHVYLILMGELLHDAPTDENNGRPEVLRGDLRQILIDSLPNETIEWNKKWIV